MKRMNTVPFATIILLGALGLSNAHADEAEELAKKLANPISSLISVPIQVNYDADIGASDDGYRVTTNIQPVVPIELNEDWNLISRTILPIIQQEDIAPGAGSQFGLGDTVQSLFFSPAQPTSNGITWGIGPVLLLPTATDDLLGTEKWGAGPTGVVLMQRGPWTVGGLANHVWSFAGDSSRADVNATFVQPFLAYTTQSAWTYTVQTESTYNWTAEQWSIPLAAVVSKVTAIGEQRVSVSAGMRYWAESPDSGPEGLAGRFVVSFLFPK